MISEYKLINEIYRKDQIHIVKGIRLSDKKPVIIKILNNFTQNVEDAALFVHEYQILSQLSTLKTVPSVLDYLEEENKLVMILNDIGGETIEYLLKNSNLSITDFIHLSLLITSALHDIHQNGYIHKDINPSNIIWNKNEDRINIIDFSISTKLSHEIIEYNSSNIIQGTIAYMSPEQTGRMNRYIDCRSDFYSLGVLFYKMLTGDIPFISNDPLELIHMHIAKNAIPVHEINNNIPEAISMIVNKLMAKNAEERYQNSHGIIEDLKHCEHEWKTNKTIKLFPIGKKDLYDRFELPQKLYGRKNEIESLLESFNKVCLGSREISIISGSAGVGKTTIIKEMQKYIIENNGYFIQGKFDQLQKSISALGLREIIKDFTRQIISESKESISKWRELIIAGVNDNGAILTDLAPELELVLEKQPELSEVNYNAAESRFISVINNFIKSIASKEHPIVIFIEDLQWADAITLKVIKNWAFDDAFRYIYLILSYRENELDKIHPVNILMKDLDKAEINYQMLCLKPLDVDSVHDYISDIMHVKNNLTSELANICYDKTFGNPFYLKHFLLELYNCKLIYFDYTNNEWLWDINKIQQQCISNNVIDILLLNLDRMEKKTKDALSLAACIGDTFDLKTLSYLLNKTHIETARILEIALQENYIFPLDNNYLYATDIEDAQVSYKFSHDKIRELLYEFLSESKRNDVQLKIGHFLLNNLSKEEIENNALKIASYFIKNKSNINNQEKYIISELNLSAGIKSKLSQSYEQAIEFFQMAIDLLSESDWDTHYDLLLSIYNEAAEAYCFLRKDENVKLIYDIINKHALVIEDKLRINRTRLFYAIAKGDPYEATNIGINYLHEFGLNYKIKTPFYKVILVLIKVYISDKKTTFENLKNLPTIRDKKIISMLQIMVDTCIPAAEISSELYIIIACHSFLITIKYGVYDFSPFIFINYGILQAGIFNKYKIGNIYAQIGLQLFSRFTKKYYARSICLFIFFFEHLTKPTNENLDSLSNAYNEALEIGDFQSSVMALNFQSVLETNSGCPLGEVIKNIHDRLKYLKKFNLEFEDRYRIVNEQSLLNFINISDKPAHLLSGPIYDESYISPINLFKKDNFGIAYVYIQKLWLAYVFEDYEAALRYVKILRSYKKNILSSPNLLFYLYYSSLTYIACYMKGSWYEKITYRIKLRNNIQELQRLIQFGSNDALHKYYLVKAELFRIDNKFKQAMELYDESIKGAMTENNTIDIAIGRELEGKFFLKSNNIMIAKLYLLEAYHYYKKWGANSKLHSLENTYAWLKNIDLQRDYLRSALKILKSNTAGFKQETLDYSTILKTSAALVTEINLPNLITRILSLLTQNMGAERGVLLLMNNNQLYVEGEYHVTSGAISIMQSLSLEIEKTLLPLTIIQYSSKTHNHVILEDASKSNLYMRDFYIKHYQPKSVLCFPILNQGNLLGLIYLENNLIADCFTKQRLELINILSSQLATSLQNARLYSSFERFVPRQMLELIGKKQIIDVKLGDNVHIFMTSMFTDIRNFTTITEKRNASSVFKLLNEYLGTIEPIITKHNGFIDKYIGDAILALFPDKPDDAILAGIDILRALDGFNKDHHDKFETGIGISSGLCMLGTVGSAHRMDSTIISNSVNTASRIQSLNKVYGANLLIDNTVIQSLQKKDFFTMRCIEKVKLRGKHKVDTIWEILDYLPEEIKTKRMSNLAVIDQIKVSLKNKDTDLAKALLKECLIRDPSDPLLSVYLERCDKLILKKKLK